MGGRHEESEYFFANGRAIDTSRYFVIVANMLGNGYSISPNNTPGSIRAGNFPLVTVYDNVRCQRLLITEHLAIQRLRLVTGFSMGAQQSYQWRAMHSNMIDTIVPICGATRIVKHNHIFIEGYYEIPPVRGLLTFGHVYAAWLFSQYFFRETLYEQLNFTSREDVVRFTQKYFLANDANNLIAMAQTWVAMDISANPLYKGNFEAALKGTTCKAIVMLSDSYLYFRVTDNEYEVSHVSNATIRPIASKWRHAAGFGIDTKDN